MNVLPKHPHVFLYWWAVETPKYLFNLIRKLIIMANSQIAFTTNLRLIFTPLFGDYTIVGRFIGFTVRIFEIFFGIIIVSVLLIVAVILPLIWWLAPIYLFLEIHILVLPLIAALFMFWHLIKLNTPVRRVNNVSNNEYDRAFRPKSSVVFNKLSKDFNKGSRDVLKIPEIEYLLKKAELNIPEFKDKISNSPIFDIKDLGTSIIDFARENKSRFVEPEHIFWAFVSRIPKIELILSTYGTTPDLLKNTCKWLVEERELYDKMYFWQEDYESLFTGGFGKGMTGRVTPFLDSMSEDYTKQALRGGYKRFTVREKCIKKIAELLSGSNENLLIVGEPGCGKTSAVKGIAYKIMEGNEFKALSNKRIVSMELAGIVSGTASVGDIASRLKGAIQEAKGSGDIILFIDEIHTLVAGGGQKSSEISSIYSILEPELAANDIQFIAATTLQNYRKYIEPNGAFSRLFNLMEIDEASKEETIEILKYEVRKLEPKHHVLITYNALEKSVTLSKKLIHERVLPDKAVQILSRTATSVTETTKYLNSEAVSLEIAEMTHIPAAIVSDDESKRLLSIEEDMKKMVIGQDHALKQVGSAIKRARAGMRNENKPIASFLFVGTTGVGKTQTAKALAKTYFGNSKNMVRLDMSEYQQLDSISRLLGSPNGDSKGILTEAVRTKPFTLLLLDEIEKAHPNILLTFLQVLDDGRLTDSSGLVIDFTNTIIIATSNVGTRSIQGIFEKHGTLEEMTQTAMQDVRSQFAPEFLNRFTGIIVFNPLDETSVRKITHLLLSDVVASADVKGIKLDFKEEVIDELMKRGYNPEWGARPMARVIEDTVESYLAEKILSKEFKQGDEISLGMEAFTE